MLADILKIIGVNTHCKVMSSTKAFCVSSDSCHEIVITNKVPVFFMTCADLKTYYDLAVRLIKLFFKLFLK